MFIEALNVIGTILLFCLAFLAVIIISKFAWIVLTMAPTDEDEKKPPNDGKDD